MYAINGVNVNENLANCLWLLKTGGIRAASRNGPVILMEEPVGVTTYQPKQRVLFSPLRDANPFFHLYEAIWMLAGRQDVESVAYYNSRMREYSDDGSTLHAAYGYRWQETFGVNQIRHTIDLLRSEPHTRRAVIAMWDPGQDCWANHRKDIPCNTHIYFGISSRGLDMTVCNRSNDLVWGMMGANVVHLSFLQEFIANDLGIPIGQMVQFTNNLHIYEQHWHMLDNPGIYEDDRYCLDVEAHPRLLEAGEAIDFLHECKVLIRSPHYAVRNSFLRDVVQPAMLTWHARKNGEDYMTQFVGVKDCDWKVAMSEWLARRADNELAE